MLGDERLSDSDGDDMDSTPWTECRFDAALTFLLNSSSGSGPLVDVVTCLGTVPTGKCILAAALESFRSTPCSAYVCFLYFLMASADGSETDNHPVIPEYHLFFDCFFFCWFRLLSGKGSHFSSTLDERLWIWEGIRVTVGRLMILSPYNSMLESSAGLCEML